jgi:hypothetical protein
MSLVLEGRENAELPEQSLCAVRIRGLDLPKIAREVELCTP